MTPTSKILGVLLVAGLCLSPKAQAQAPEADAGDLQTIGYFLGFSVGQQMQSSGFAIGDFNLDSLKQGFSDALSQKEPSLTDEQLKATEGKIQALLTKRMTERMASKKAEGAKWLADNAKEEGVKTLEGGLQYKVLVAGKGASPKATDTVRVHYTGKLTNGEVFDSSVKRGQPAEFAVGRVIPGWTQGLQKMKVGDKWMLYIPSDLAYGERGSPPAIGPNEVLVFEVELLAIL